MTCRGSGYEALMRSRVISEYQPTNFINSITTLFTSRAGMLSLIMVRDLIGSSHYWILVDQYRQLEIYGNVRRQ